MNGTPDKDIRTIKILGFDVPLTKTAIQALSIVAVLFVVWIFWETKIDPYLEKMERGKMAAKQLAEFRKHFAEPEAYSTEAVQGKLWIRFYESDGCVLVKRNQVQVWVPNPELIPATMSPGKITHNHSGIVSTAEAGGQCLHDLSDANFSQWTGEVRGCYIQVWRQWPDGCKLYLWFDSCNSIWDINPYWVECYH